MLDGYLQNQQKRIYCEQTQTQEDSLGNHLAFPVKGSYFIL